MPSAPFLLPGVGAQGGRVEELAAAFAPGRAGGLVVGLAQHRRRPSGGAAASPPQAARAEAERLRESAWELSRARSASRRGPLACAWIAHGLAAGR